MKASKEYNFGIIMSRPETQGFGIQEIMACNLPLIVWDQTTNDMNTLRFLELLLLFGMKIVRR